MKCDSCNQEIEIGEWPFCPHGFKERSVAANGFPFTTTHIDGTSRTFNSERELQQACKEHGVNHRPDVAWLEKRIVGTSQEGKPIYKEGNGVGLPGCWV